MQEVFYLQCKYKGGLLTYSVGYTGGVFTYRVGYKGGFLPTV